MAHADPGGHRWREVRTDRILLVTDMDGDARHLYWRALVQMREKTPRPQAEALLRRYLAREPNDAQARMGLVDVQMARVVPDSSIGVESLPPPGLKALEKDVIGLVRVASTPAQLNAVGWYYALLHRPQTGLNVALRALEIAARAGRP